LTVANRGADDLDPERHCCAIMVFYTREAEELGNV
jgi:hypothetical protein